MRTQPERILLFRSGRHLGVALAALRRESPGCDITVVTTPAGASALDEAGVPANRRVLFERTPLFQPLAFASSGAARVLWRRFDRVCVLWSNPNGAGHSNVDRTALLVSPSGFTAVTADGQLVLRPTWPVIRREARRAVRSSALLAGLCLAVFLPARVLRPFRH